MKKGNEILCGGLVTGFMAGLLVFAFLDLLFTASGKPQPELRTFAVPPTPPAITRVIDGDTVCVDVRLIDDVWLHNAPMRLLGINCPEMNTPEGVAAKAFTERWIAGRDCHVVLSSKRDKYGRLLGDVAAGDQMRLTADLLENGHAKKVSY